MSIVPGRDVPAVPEEWTDAVNKAINDANHEDLCNCGGWPDACVSGHSAGRWDSGVSLEIAVGVLEPLIRARLAEGAEPQLIHPLVAQIVENNVKQAAWLSDAVIGDVTHRAERAEAELWLVRSSVGRLIGGDWAPSTAAIEQALYPEPGTIDACVAHKEGN